jgi:hypothetical protein
MRSRRSASVIGGLSSVMPHMVSQDCSPSKYAKTVDVHCLRNIPSTLLAKTIDRTT